MNNSYTIENGKVFVSNQDGIINKRDYNDNIEEILVEENILESMQNEIKDIEVNYINIGKFTKKIITSKLPLFTIISLSLFAVMMQLPTGNTNPTVVLVGDVLGTIGCTFIGICGDVVKGVMKKQFVTKEERYKSLMELESIQKSKIESLKNEKSIKNINSNVETVSLDHDKESEMINSMINDYNKKEVKTLTKKRN